MWYNTFTKWLLNSPLHGMLDGSVMLVTCTGRKSGKAITTPVNYIREGNELTVISQRERTWWRNLRGGAPVILRLQGQDRQATGRAIEDNAGVVATLTQLLKTAPQYGKYMRVNFDAQGQPNAQQVAQAAQGRVMVQFQLT